MGGAIAQLMAVRHPERVRSLTLACTACRNHQWRRELLASWAAAATEHGMGAMSRRGGALGDRPTLVPPADAGVRLARTAGARAARRTRSPPRCGPSWRTTTRIAEQLDDITVPTLVVVGNQDILTPRGDSEELAEQLPNAELVVISGAAHGLMVEHATTFNRVLFEFLNRQVRQQRADDRQAVVAAAS